MTSQATARRFVEPAPETVAARRPLPLSFLAALIWGLGACAVSRADDQANTIVVGGDVDHGALHAFEKARGRHPNREELLALHRVFIDNEILYREGLKLKLDPGDSANRERVIFKALSVIDGSVRPSSVTDDELRRWFESHRAKYEQPARFDFEEAALSGKNSEAAVRAFVEELNRGVAADSRTGLRVFKGRPEANVIQSYGQEVLDALVEAPPGTWLALRSRDGWRAMRLNAMAPKTRAEFETLRGAVRQDWIEATTAEKRAAAVQALWKKYKIEFAEKHECLADK